MRVAVIGAGALGTLFGGLLARDEHDVWLLHHREAYVRQIRSSGVVIESEFLPGGDVKVEPSATTEARDAGTVDLALVLVKAHQTREALEAHDACLDQDSRVLTLQNGIRCYDIVRDFAGAQAALGGVTYQGARRKAPGVVVHTKDGETVFGGPDGAFAHRLCDVFDAAGFREVSVVAEPRQAIWNKLLLDVAIKPVAALTRLSHTEIATDDWLVETMERLMVEATAVAEARGVEVSTHERFNEVVEFLSGSPHRSSMLEDVEAERPTEIDAVNGAVVDLAESHGVDVPYNQLMTALISGLERSYTSSSA